MTFDFLPPQAYTKETLLKAYNWLQSQSDQVKELATTPDQLVSLFLKSTRLGQDSLQRYTNSNTIPSVQVTPPSSNGHADKEDRPSLQNFKSELKNLAGMMGDLEKPPAAQAPGAQATYQTTAAFHPGTNSGSGYQSPVSQNQINQAPMPPYQGPAGASPYGHGTSVHSPSGSVPASTTNAYVSPSAPANAYVSSSTQNSNAYVSTTQPSALTSTNYDEMTQNLIREVKNELNLSSDTEALRMLVKIGYQKVKSLYK